jgi:uncharacterized protein (DUF427 family)
MSERGLVKIERSAKRVRAFLGGQLVADTVAPLLVWESPHYPTYYIPDADVRVSLEPTGEVAHSPSRGDAQVLDVAVGGSRARGAALRYADSPLEALRQAVRLEWSAMDEWMEEDEPVYTHARDPHTRIDVLASSRLVEAAIDGVPIASSDQPRILFETGLPPRYYLPLTAYARGLLRPSPTTSACPYKGTATYFHVEVNGTLHEDMVWIYRAPFHDAAMVAGLAAPYNEKLTLTVDGAPAPGSPAVPR